MRKFYEASSMRAHVLWISWSHSSAGIVEWVSKIPQLIIENFLNPPLTGKEGCDLPISIDKLASVVPPTPPPRPGEIKSPRCSVLIKADSPIGCNERNSTNFEQPEIKKSFWHQLQIASRLNGQCLRLEHHWSSQRHEAWTKSRQALAGPIWSWAIWPKRLW